jgi:hypothetical protein
MEFYYGKYGVAHFRLVPTLSISKLQTLFVVVKDLQNHQIVLQAILNS